MSGGTKRKVCAAVSLLGRPRLVLMDEPTSGMDVLAKRQTWQAIRSELAGGMQAACPRGVFEALRADLGVRMELDRLWCSISFYM